MNICILLYIAGSACVSVYPNSVARAILENFARAIFFVVFTGFVVFPSFLRFPRFLMFFWVSSQFFTFKKKIFFEVFCNFLSFLRFCVILSVILSPVHRTGILLKYIIFSQNISRMNWTICSLTWVVTS